MSTPREPVTFEDPSLYINRELSMLAFQRRVLEEAQDPTNPLYERVKFTGIVASNLDEFFMVRVAGVKQQLTGNVSERSADGKLPQEQLLQLAHTAQALVSDLDKVFSELTASLRSQADVYLWSPAELSPEQTAVAREFFLNSVFPVLTPLAIDPGHPFPQLRNKSLNVCLFLRRAAPAGREA